MTGPDLSQTAAIAALAGVGGAARDDPRDAYARVWWSVLAEPGDGAAGDLVERFGPEDALRIALSDAEDEWTAARARWMPRADPGAIRHALDAARRADATLLIPSDSRWPHRVNDLGVHTPHVLWARGDLEPLAASPTYW